MVTYSKFRCSRFAVCVGLAVIWSFTPVVIVASHLAESDDDKRALKDCASEALPPAIRQALKDTIRLEFQKVNPSIEDVVVLDIRCASDGAEKPLGAIVLGYGTVSDTDEADRQFRETRDIYALLANEQFGVFQYDASLTTLIKIIKVMPSRRWLDYRVTIELRGSDKLILNAAGATYGDQPKIEEFNLFWQ